MTKQHTIDRQTKELEGLRAYVADLKSRHDKAIDTLSDLSRGLGIAPNDYNKNHHGWDVCMRRLAADELAKIAKMPLRESR